MSDIRRNAIVQGDCLDILKTLWRWLGDKGDSNYI